ncbi:MAG: hypothetical protein EU533_07940 [Promethearchaeota archaeon]|nr:MAG: hypothetical protein EU533_07940 [Candidatus Lokiarchaeota archaeon]
MNFWKTFIITFVVYLALNTVFVLIAMFTNPFFPATDVIFIIASIFSPIATSPQIAWIDNGIVPLLATTDLVTDLTLFLSYIIPPLIAIIVGALLGDNQFTGFGAWFLTAFLSSCLFIVFLAVGQAGSTYTLWGDLISNFGTMGAMISIFFAGIVNGFFYGCICALITKKWM